VLSAERGNSGLELEREDMFNRNPFDFIPWILDHQERFLSLLTQHIELVLVAVLLGVLIAVPLGIVATRVPALAGPMTWVAGVGQTVPSLAILGLALPIMGIGFVPSVFALTIRALMPIFINTYVGIHNADRSVIDAARGMGANSTQRLLFAELPLASPVIFTGIRTATVQTVGLATLAAFIGGGGLGDLILQGLALVDVPVLLAGAIPVAVLAIGADIVLGRIFRLAVPRGLQTSKAKAV
jgi:osmoprotectant transport system permease protein